MNINVVVFDIGNVLVRWDPYSVINEILPQENSKKFFQKMSSIWTDLNLGKLSEDQAIKILVNQGLSSQEKISELMYKFKSSQTPIPGSFELIKKLYNQKIPLYSITDNIKEIVEFYKSNYDFLSYFKKVIVSANIGVMKPSPTIYQYLLTQCNLKPQECVFIDDLSKNVKGAVAVGMHAFQFISALDCEAKLVKLGVIKTSLSCKIP